MESILVTSGNAVTIELGIMIDDDFIVKVFSEAGEFIKSTKVYFIIIRSKCIL